MGLLDRLFRGRRTPEAVDARPLTPDQAMARWRYLVRRAPPEVLSETHARGLDSLGEVPRAEVVQRLRAALSALDSGVMVPSDAAVVVRAAAGMERRTPGFLERALAADARGRQTLAGLAAVVVASSAAAPFLRGFEPGLEPGALEPRRGRDFEDAPDQLEGPGGQDSGHDGDLDDED
jgi:hypothetical protein